MKTPPAKILWALCAVALCSGCETAYPTNPVGLTRESAASIKTIGVVRPTNPESTYFLHPKAWGTIGRVGQASLALGLVGALFVGPFIAAEQNWEAKEFEQKVGTPNRNLNEWMGKALEEELSRDGYIVKLINPPARKPDQYVMNYSALAEGLDAILDVKNRQVRILERAKSGCIRPVDCRTGPTRLEDGKTTFYRDCSIYGSEMPFIDAFSIPADRKFFFRDFEAVVGDPERAVQGLQAAVTAIASRVGQQLKPQDSGIFFYGKRKGSFGSGTYLYVLKIEVDGKVVGYLMPKHFLYVPMTPGRHQIRSVMGVNVSAESLADTAEIEIESGKDTYIRTDFVNKHFRSLIEIVPVPEAAGKKAVKAMKGS